MKRNQKRPDFFDQVTLLGLLDMYEDHFVGKIYEYETRHRVSPLRIYFEYNQFPHLIGLHYFNLGRANDINSKIKSGEITITTLKEKNPQLYEDEEYRIMFFSLLAEMMLQPMIGERTAGPSKVRFYCYDNNYNWVYYLGVSNEGAVNPDQYYPMTFIENQGPIAKKAGRIQAPYKKMRVLDLNGNEIITTSF